ncbi:putative DNA metabolism protein [[Clostridium] methylpentosum DSM 5476]|uniref:Putative DNA metabolism protein n=1 Tax=[Clostridium] methylpentosum DSM 5476 TaxID=537013 RepID=C0EHT0_9FIRM|nr:putative DNA metabolism protein [[Clostridium] methylpentosum DSM 5476]MDY3988073.1 TIGR03915 family putative DNA repair protein [Massilioclostridium sp.]MEE1491940.1 TIGR03915 family putative DNA repair protein [Massilioclostridium sp.]
MPVNTSVIYLYDGSFDGLMCCIAESCRQHELPTDILADGCPQLTLHPTRRIPTDRSDARKVVEIMQNRISPAAVKFVKMAYLTYISKELPILQFFRLGYRYGKRVFDMHADETVCTLRKAVQHLRNESHRFKQFVRFTEYDGKLIARIEPKNCVLPMIAPHFAERLPNEQYLIYDKTNRLALVHQPGHSAILPLDSFEPDLPGEAEREFRCLWKLYYDTIGIEGRYNPKCRMTMMPKRYWTEMPEFDSENDTRPESGQLPPPSLHG